MLDKIKDHRILVICGILVTLTAGAGAIGKWTDFSFTLWASAAEVKVIQTELIIAASDRKKLHYNDWNNRAKDTQQQLYLNKAEQRKYKRRKESVPEDVFKQQHFLKQQHQRQINKRNTYK